MLVTRAVIGRQATCVKYGSKHYRMWLSTQNRDPTHSLKVYKICLPGTSRHIDGDTSMGHISPSYNSRHSEHKMLDIDYLAASSERLWVFGYGSLVWKTGFEYSDKKIGYIGGYLRRFWQGCVSHRGTPSKPGRVATLTKDETRADSGEYSNRAWGVAFELVGAAEIQSALQHLGMRECTLGGYDIEVVPFIPRDDPTNAVECIVCNALPSNPNYVGDSDLETLAYRVISSQGPSGHNVEYITELAAFVRTYIPEDDDEHLFNLDRRIRAILGQRGICVTTLISQARVESKKFMKGNEVYKKLWKDIHTTQNETKVYRLHDYNLD